MIELTNDYTQRGRAMAVPGAYWDRKRKAFCVSVEPKHCDPRAAAVILALYPNLYNEYPELDAKRAELYTTARPHDFSSELDLKLSTDTWDYMDVNPYRFQDRDAAYLKAQLPRLGGGFMTWSRGLGKTIGAIAITRALQAKRTLVVCGNTMKDSVWRAELDGKVDRRIHVLSNAKAKREKELAEIAANRLAPVVLVIHYEQLAIIAGGKGRGQGWNKLGAWDVMIFDEAHRLANPSTNMWRGATRAGKHSKVRLALTGTPIMNHGEDLFGQLKWLFPKTYRNKWEHWNWRFLDYVQTEYGQVCIGFRPDALPQLRKELGVFMVYRTKEDELDLPARTEETRLVDLSARQRKAYDDIKEQFWHTLESDETITATNVLAQLNLLRRIATGLDAKDAEVRDSSKIDFAMALLEDNPDEAFVVFSWYKAPLFELARRLKGEGIGHHIITGDTPQRVRGEAVAAFQAGEGRCFLGTLSTLGESVNLQRANNAIFLDRAWNPATNAQAADRIYRIGQERPVTITHIVARNTVDELRVQPVLASKEIVRKAVFGG